MIQLLIDNKGWQETESRSSFILNQPLDPGDSPWYLCTWTLQKSLEVPLRPFAWSGAYIFNMLLENKKKKKDWEMDVLQNKASSKNAPWPHRDPYRHSWKIKMVSIC